MSGKSLAVLGLPGSGKTTFLAALWHVVTEREIDVKLKFVTLRAGNSAHLVKIAERWRQAKSQERTATDGDQLVSMSLKAENRDPDVVVFPDLAGESFRDMWEERQCTMELATHFGSEGILLFVHADKINAPGWVADLKQQCEVLGLNYDPDGVVPWNPRLAPTQVQLVDLLQMLQSEPLDIGPRRLAIILSAWDKVRAERRSPEDYLKQELPLLFQFLNYGLDTEWSWRIYGVSAQGGDYDGDKKTSPDAEPLRNIDCPSKRIAVVYGGEESHDLTDPLCWVLGS
ncbi:ATP-binding protein [Rhodanobacter sp. MP1X3]|uniref:TRAFAC clade GTPase domain-containing protein n=1 Tax=Rhodanobacter sp. MP1X3 TaxID=2723086 RepID=UPI001618E802|nr:ATP-binding protein [Rhodanobacter sp. MP1X3]MBB6241979.1 energy-coupling factor transporter ATP-binding protein EcfA2 [Rhodanobacter sp. MP1X3]